MNIFLAIFFSIVSTRFNWISIEASEVTVRPGENITFYCDCKRSTGVYIVWFRNCSHENQPSLFLSFIDKLDNNRYLVKLKNFPRFEFVENTSSNSYDLLIINVTKTDEGLYYCGTKEIKVDEKEKIRSNIIYTYGNITARLIIGKDDFSNENTSCKVAYVFWMSAFTPAFTILSSFPVMILFYHFCQITGEKARHHQKGCYIRGQTKSSLDEDMCLTQVVFQVQKIQTIK